MGTPQTVLLGNARDGKRLAGKTCRQDVVLWDSVCGQVPNIAKGLFPEICLVGLLCVFVPVAGQHAPTLRSFKSETYAAYATKQVNKCLRSRSHLRFLGHTIFMFPSASEI